jgi:nicotinamidase-related amidase
MTAQSTDIHDGVSVVAGSRPYPWPWDGRIDPSSLALLVIQAPGPLQQAPGPLAAIGALAETIERAGASTISLVTHPPFRRGAPLTGAGSSSVDVIPGTTGAVVRVESPGWNGFFESTLDVELRRRGITHILLTGYWLEVGVHSTMRAGNDMGYECLLVEDAIVAAEPSITPASLSSIEMSGGIFGAIGTSAAVHDALRLVAPSS